MIKYLMTTAAAALLMGCGSEAPKPAENLTAKTLTPGEYEVNGEVTKLVSTDKTTPGTAAKLGDKTVTRGCVADTGNIDPAMFIDAGDNCSAQSSYVRSGRLSVQYQCTRPGRGNVYPAADGNFSADAFEAVVTVGTAFTGDGDYNLTRRLTAKRVGNCPAKGAAPGAPAAPAAPAAG